MACSVPHDPFGLVPPSAYRPTARRTLRVCGASAELVWLPERKQRPGRPEPDQPPFRRSRIDAILGDETVWRDGACALTANPYPFAARQAILWSALPAVEPALELLGVALQIEERTGGAVLVNSLGAAASFARAHAHLIAEPSGFLDELPREPLAAPWLPPLHGVDVLRIAAPFPIVAVGVAGPAADRARALGRLLELRTGPAFNIVSQRGTSWLFPRTRETPGPMFPQALGAAELWGRWCFQDEAPFRGATPHDLSAALLISGHGVSAAGDGGGACA